MELDELKTAWRELNERVEANEAQLHLLQQQQTLAGMRTPLAFVRTYLTFEIVSNIVIVLLTGSFLGNGPHTLKFLIPGLCLHLFGMIGLGVSLWQIIALERMDYSAPVITLQKRLLRLWASRSLYHRGVLLIAPLLWVPLAIVAAKALLGLDLYSAFGMPWIVVNILFGVAFIPLMLFLSHRFAGHISAAWIRNGMDDIAGRNLRKAAGMLEEVTDFAGS